MKKYTKKQLESMSTYELNTRLESVLHDANGLFFSRSKESAQKDYEAKMQAYVDAIKMFTDELMARYTHSQI